MNIVRAAGAHWEILHAVVLAPLRHSPGRLGLATLAIALGVALGVAVHLINASAVSEFRTAARHLAGEADLVVRGPRAGFDEALYPRLAGMAGIEALNPALEIDVQLSGRSESIRVLAFDPMRAARVQPALLPQRTSMLSDLLADDTVLLSPEAAQWLGLKAGDELRLAAGTQSLPFRIAWRSDGESVTSARRASHTSIISTTSCVHRAPR